MKDNSCRMDVGRLVGGTGGLEYAEWAEGEANGMEGKLVGL